MRRSLLGFLSAVLILAAVPPAMASPLTPDGSSTEWWSFLRFVRSVGDSVKAASSDEALPHLDPDGMTATIPDSENPTSDTDVSTQLDPDLSALPHLDPDG